jgi:hypothetical protein
MIYDTCEDISAVAGTLGFIYAIDTFDIKDFSFPAAKSNICLIVEF